MPLLDFVDEDTLSDIQDSYMDYLGSLAGIYDGSGEFVTLHTVSGYCKLLYKASRELCGEVEDDEAAIASGKWICHKHCRSALLECVRSEKLVEHECPGGMLIYAAPIIVEGTVLGSICAGISNPPLDRSRIWEIAAQYHVDQARLFEAAEEYRARPDDLFQAAKQHILLASRMIAAIYEKNIHKNLDERIEAIKDANAKLVLAHIDTKDFSNALEMQVRERMADIEEKKAELERMNKLFVGRELRMIELKNEIKKLKKELEGSKEGTKDAETSVNSGLSA